MGKTGKMIVVLIFSLLCLLLFVGEVGAELWEFGSSGPENYPFLPKGYMIVTDSGEYWLSSRFRNTVGGVLYTGTINGLSYVDATKADGSPYMLYALTDRNPRDYKYLTAYKNGAVIEDFSSYAGAPGRVEEEDYMGSNANWRIPFIYGEEWKRRDILDEVSIPIGELRRESNPAPLILLAAFLALLAAALLIPEFAVKKKDSRRG